MTFPMTVESHFRNRYTTSTDVLLYGKRTKKSPLPPRAGGWGLRGLGLLGQDAEPVAEGLSLPVDTGEGGAAQTVRLRLGGWGGSGCDGGGATGATGDDGCVGGSEREGYAVLRLRSRGGCEERGGALRWGLGLSDAPDTAEPWGRAGVDCEGTGCATGDVLMTGCRLGHFVPPERSRHRGRSTHGGL